jgi:hypothetical protein
VRFLKLLSTIALTVLLVGLPTPLLSPTFAIAAQSQPEKKEAKVWVNTKSGVYHCPGSRWYGTTEQGKYMPECEAQKEGYRPACGNPCGSECTTKTNKPRPPADNSPPAGATAQCRDGTYSFSQHRRGTCSHHGGVARWL